MSKTKTSGVQLGKRAYLPNNEEFFTRYCGKHRLFKTTMETNRVKEFFDDKMEKAGKKKKIGSSFDAYVIANSYAWRAAQIALALRELPLIKKVVKAYEKNNPKTKGYPLEIKGKIHYLKSTELTANINHQLSLLKALSNDLTGIPLKKSRFVKYDKNGSLEMTEDKALSSAKDRNPVGFFLSPAKATTLNKLAEDAEIADPFIVVTPYEEYNVFTTQNIITAFLRKYASIKNIIEEGTFNFEETHFKNQVRIYNSSIKSNAGSKLSSQDIFRIANSQRAKPSAEASLELKEAQKERSADNAADLRKLAVSFNRTSKEKEDAKAHGKSKSKKPEPEEEEGEGEGE